jgi:signal transduction histidine kinase
MKPAAQRPEPQYRSRTARRFTTIGFTLIGAGIVGTMIFMLGETRKLQNGTRGIIDEMVSSVRLIGQLSYLVEKRRVLIDDHIFEKQAPAMATLETEIASIDSQIAAASRTYEPWVNRPGEREAWQRVQAAIAALAAPTAQALALSRANRDFEARRLMEQVAGTFAEIDAGLDALTAINNEGATASLARLAEIRRRVLIALVGIGVAALAGTGLVGTWAARQVARREAETALYARLLDARNSELDAFAGRVAHDIRGPLTSINLTVTSLAGQISDHSFEILLRGTRRMDELVDDLLTLARSETQAHGRCDPASVAGQVGDDFRERVEAAQGTLRLSVAPAEIACSEGLLRQALANLVENAVKYRRPEAAPVVELSGAISDGGYDLRVSDNGAGMTKEDAAHASEPFYRSPRMREISGTGLGLAIVNRVAEASGGSLSIETKLGEGSTFVIHLPLVAPRDAADRPQGP